jgi:MYXO-CTERM domain-containing protein
VNGKRGFIFSAAFGVALLALAWAPLPVSAQMLFIPNGSEVDTVASDGSVSFLASGVGYPFGLTYAATSGNLYVADFFGHDVSEVTPGGAVSSFVSGLAGTQLTGEAIDYFGNLYVASDSTNSIYKITPGGSVSTFATGLSGPWGLAFDSNRNLYVANSGNNTISEITPSGSASTFASGLNYPQGLAFDASGNLYEADYNAGIINEINPSGAVSTFVSGFNDPQSLAFDASGNLYIGGIYGGQNIVFQVTPGKVVSTFVPASAGISSVYFLASTYVAPVPEPAEAATLVGVAALAAGWLHRRRKQAVQ